MQIFAPTAAYLFDVLGFTRKWLRDVALDQRADGCVANMSPLPPVEGFDGPLGRLHGSAGWGDVVVAAPWDLYQAYGDASLLRESWPAMTAWLDYAARPAAGGRHPDRAAAPARRRRRTSGTCGTPASTGGSGSSRAPVITDFRAFAAADKSEVATAYLHRSAGDRGPGGRAARRRRRRPWPATGARRRRAARRGGPSSSHPDGTLAVQTQAAHVRALAFGLVPDELRPAIADRLVELVDAAGGHLGTGLPVDRATCCRSWPTHGHLDTAYDAAAAGHRSRRG